jgi:hypothetical protein
METRRKLKVPLPDGADIFKDRGHFFWSHGYLPLARVAYGSLAALSRMLHGW